MGDGIGKNKKADGEVVHRCHTVQLIPYQHQVGGHQGLLAYDKNTICKPLNEQEMKAYNSFPSELKEFIPQFCGMVKVYFEKCNEDILCFALPSDCSNCKDDRRRSLSYVRCDGVKEMPFENDTIKSENKDGRKGKDSPNISSFPDCYKKVHKLEKFIKLECISKHYKFPCIIDLKMGTRGYGDFASKDKRLRKEKRINDSTSRTLGVRLCGMQVYSVLSKEYTFVDKYAGRSFTEEEFKTCLKNFLYNGAGYRTELIKQLLQRLDTLRSHLRKLEGFRFFSSSLLVMYDGQPNDSLETSGSPSNSSDLYPDVEVRMIDFANARLKEEDSNPHVGPDLGYILGITSLIDIFSEIQQALCNAIS